MNSNISVLHNTICERLSDLAQAVDELFVAADAAAEIAEADPKLSAYLEALAPLMSIAVPSAPPSPKA